MEEVVFDTEKYVDDLVQFLLQEFAHKLQDLPRSVAAELIDGMHENLSFFKELLVERLNEKLVYTDSADLNEDDLIEAASQTPLYQEIFGS